MFPSYKETTSRITLDEIGINDMNVSDIWRETGTDIGEDQGVDVSTLIQNIENHTTNFLTDLNGDGKYTCEDLVYLLYLGTNHIR